MDKYFHLFMNTITQFWGTVLSGLREIIIQDISNDYLFIYFIQDASTSKWTVRRATKLTTGNAGTEIQAWALLSQALKAGE